MSFVPINTKYIIAVNKTADIHLAKIYRSESKSSFKIFIVAAVKRTTAKAIHLSGTYSANMSINEENKAPRASITVSMILSFETFL